MLRDEPRDRIRVKEPVSRGHSLVGTRSFRVTKSRHLTLLRRPFPLRCCCLVASSDPLLLVLDTRHDYEHEWKEEDKEGKRDRERQQRAEKEREEKRRRRIQETEGVQAGKRGIATGSVPILPGIYADLKFNAMKGLPPLLFIPPPHHCPTFVF